MTVEESSSPNKTKHKLFLGFLKIIPMVLALIYMTNTTLSYFDIDLPILSYIGGTGIIPWLFILMASYLFKFCQYHRIFLWYILVNNLLCFIDMEYHLPISNWSYFVLHIIIVWIFIFAALYAHQRNRKLHSAL